MWVCDYCVGAVWGQAIVAAAGENHMCLCYPQHRRGVALEKAASYTLLSISIELVPLLVCGISMNRRSTMKDSTVSIWDRRPARTQVRRLPRSQVWERLKAIEKTVLSCTQSSVQNIDL